MSSFCVDWGLVVLVMGSVEMELAGEEIDGCRKLSDCGRTVLGVEKWQWWVSRSWERCCPGRLSWHQQAVRTRRSWAYMHDRASQNRAVIIKQQQQNQAPC
jgi:hypothetical protein